MEKPSLQNGKSTVSAPAAKRFKAGDTGETLEKKPGFEKAANAFIQGKKKKSGEGIKKKDLVKLGKNIISTIEPLTLLIPDAENLAEMEKVLKEVPKAKTPTESPEELTPEEPQETTQEVPEKVTPEPQEVPTEPEEVPKYTCIPPPVNPANLPLVTLYMCPRCANATSQKYAINFGNHVHQTFCFCNRCIEVNHAIAKVLSL